MRVLYHLRVLILLDLHLVEETFEDLFSVLKPNQRVIFKRFSVLVFFVLRVHILQPICLISFFLRELINFFFMSGHNLLEIVLDIGSEDDSQVGTVAMNFGKKGRHE